MKRDLLLTIACMVLGMSIFVGQSFAACPEDTVDSGECDTLYVEILPGDELFMQPMPNYVRFPIFVTHDVPDPSLDSISAFIIPLCYTSSNQYANAVIDPAWNNTNLYPFPATDSSIFRHLDYDGHHLTNWMMALSEQQIGLEWDQIIFDISQGDNFWLAMFPAGSQDQRFPEGSRTLLAAITFTLDDTTTICIDSCFWPPSSRLNFVRCDASSYVPRHFLPVCQRIYILPCPPYFTICPGNSSHSENGFFLSSYFAAETHFPGNVVANVTPYFQGTGVQDVGVFFLILPPSPRVEGWVDYYVMDHCQPGGTMTLIAEDPYGGTGDCSFNISLVNDPPFLSLPSSWTALAGYTMILKVPAAVDQNGDSVSAVELDAFWFGPDSLQAPTNPPTYNPGDPGSFIWVPEEADTGIWICSFSATDACNDVGTHQISIQVGMPFCGDGNADASLSVNDIVFLLGYLYKQGPAPEPLCRGDANCNGAVDASDMVYLINYFFRNGPAPCFECCP